MAGSTDRTTAPVHIHQPSPLAAEVSFSPSSSLHVDSPQDSLVHERQYVDAKRTEAHEDAQELHNFRELALERQRAMAGTAGSFSSSSQGGHFEPFVGSRVGSPIPDKHGLGWPGASRSLSCVPRPSPPPADPALTRPLARAGKGTLARLESTADEKLAREKKLADAVRTVLECIGEDPDRDGLVKTPERYAKALLWMTKGYEERLPGASPSHSTTRNEVDQS